MCETWIKRDGVHAAQQVQEVAARGDSGVGGLARSRESCSGGGLQSLVRASQQVQQVTDLNRECRMKARLSAVRPLVDALERYLAGRLQRRQQQLLPLLVSGGQVLLDERPRRLAIGLTGRSLFYDWHPLQHCSSEHRGDFTA